MSVEIQEQSMCEHSRGTPLDLLRQWVVGIDDASNAQKENTYLQMQI